MAKPLTMAIEHADICDDVALLAGRLGDLESLSVILGYVACSSTGRAMKAHAHIPSVFILLPAGFSSTSKG